MSIDLDYPINLANTRINDLTNKITEIKYKLLSYDIYKKKEKKIKIKIYNEYLHILSLLLCNFKIKINYKILKKIIEKFDINILKKYIDEINNELSGLEKKSLDYFLGDNTNMCITTLINELHDITSNIDRNILLFPRENILIMKITILNYKKLREKKYENDEYLKEYENSFYQIYIDFLKMIENPICYYDYEKDMENNKEIVNIFMNYYG